MENQELKAMDAIYHALQELEPSARERVLSWVSGALQITPITKPATPRGSVFGAGNQIGESSFPIDDFESASDLFSAASPKSDPEKVLVVGAFLQAKQGKKELASMEIN